MPWLSVVVRCLLPPQAVIQVAKARGLRTINVIRDRWAGEDGCAGACVTRVAGAACIGVVACGRCMCTLHNTKGLQRHW